MIKIQFPEGRIKTRQAESFTEIFDVIRKKWLLLTPEEWVRQNMIQFLLHVMQYPSSLIAIEKEIRLAELKKRCDIVVYDRNQSPWMIIECKEMKVALSQKTLDQILRYHISLPAKYLIITNGSYCAGYQKIQNRFEEINLFPLFES